MFIEIKKHKYILNIGIRFYRFHAVFAKNLGEEVSKLSNLTTLNLDIRLKFYIYWIICDLFSSKIHIICWNLKIC